MFARSGVDAKKLQVLRTRVAPEEAEAIRARAAGDGMTVSEWLRLLARIGLRGVDGAASIEQERVRRVAARWPHEGA